MGESKFCEEEKILFVKMVEELKPLVNKNIIRNEKRINYFRTTL